MLNMHRWGITWKADLQQASQWVGEKGATDVNYLINQAYLVSIGKVPAGRMRGKTYQSHHYTGRSFCLYADDVPYLTQFIRRFEGEGGRAALAQ